MGGLCTPIAMSTWRHVLVRMQGPLQLSGDAQGVLQAVLARRARDPNINSIVAEVQLLLGPSMLDLYAAHVWSEENLIADALSRMCQGASLPDVLVGVKQSRPKRREWFFVNRSRRHSSQLEADG